MFTCNPALNLLHGVTEVSVTSYDMTNSDPS